MKYKIWVTQEDIDQGIPGNPDNCPLARAISRAVGEPFVVSLSETYRRDNPGALLLLPREAVLFRERVDMSRSNTKWPWPLRFLQRSISLKPFTFELDIPEEVSRA